MSYGPEGYALAQGEGQGIWFFNGLLTIKAGGDDTRNAFALIECELPLPPKQEPVRAPSCQRQHVGDRTRP